jgi:hypothetical protein
MSTGLDKIRAIVEKQKDCEFSLGYVIHKDKDVWKTFFTIIMLVKKGTIRELNYDYGESVIGQVLLSVKEGLAMISDLFPKNGEKGRLKILDCCEFTIDGGGHENFYASKIRHCMVKNEYPVRIFKFRVPSPEVMSNKSMNLLREGIPYFPWLSDAAINVFELEVENFSSNGDVIVAIYDYRAKIETLKLIFSKAELKLTSPEIEYEKLRIKAFAKAKNKSFVLPDIVPTSEFVQFDIGFQPDILNVVLKNMDENFKVDAKEFTIWRSEEEGIFLERPGEEILSLTKIGEKQNLEYKYDAKEENQRTDLLETVVAFSNTDGGTILVGVDDSGELVGSHTFGEDLLKSIHDTCEPPPTGIRTQEKEIDGKKIIILEVPEGEDKPYQSKKDKNWYVRHNGTDMKMERSELMRLLEKRRMGFETRY